MNDIKIVEVFDNNIDVKILEKEMQHDGPGCWKSYLNIIKNGGERWDHYIEDRNTNYVSTIFIPFDKKCNLSSWHSRTRIAVGDCDGFRGEFWMCKVGNIKAPYEKI